MLKEVEILKNLIYSLHDNGISIGDISKNTAMSKSTIHRILQNFIQEGYATQDVISKKYKAAPKTMSIAVGAFGESQFMMSLNMVLEQLNYETKETVHLISRDNWEGVYIRVKPALNQIGIRSYVGKRMPLHCTASGKIIMSHFTENELMSYIDKFGLKRYTQYTITEQELFLQEIQKIKTQNYSLDNKEHNEDIICVAVPILNKENEVVFCISISGPAYRFTTEIAQAQVPKLIEISKKMSDLYSNL